MRYSLRTLLISAGVLPPVAAGAYFTINWIVGQYPSPVAERLAVFAGSLMALVGLVCWTAIVSFLATKSARSA
jgi:hypothetical protein